MENDAKPFDPNRLAIALAYDKEKNEAPVVSAKGRGYIAEQIIALAKQHDIEIREDADLAVLLSKLEVDSPIPFEAYAAVAEILSYIYKTNDRMKHKS